MRVGLIEEEKILTVKQYLEDWLANRKVSGHVIASILAWGQSVSEMKNKFGGRGLKSLVHADGKPIVAQKAAQQADAAIAGNRRRAA